MCLLLIFSLFAFFAFVGTVGFHSKPSPEFFGTSIRAVEEEVTKKVDVYVNMLLQSAEKCEDEGVIYSLRLRISILTVL